MKEIKSIITSFNQARQQGRKAALATVVHVEGSSYRRPGARMLVTDDGQLTGAISGGCLEGDALRKALLAISQQQNKLVTYDTTNEDDAKFGVQLGCNGIVHILFEPVDESRDGNVIQLLHQLAGRRKDAVLVTLFSLEHSHQPGTSLLYQEDGMMGVLPETMSPFIMNDVQEVFTNKTSCLNIYHNGPEPLNAFIEFIPPPLAIVIAGAGNDIQPLVEMTSLLGWHTTVVDGRQTHATVQRFPKADKILVAKPGEVLPQVSVDAQTVFLLMTHNYNYDLSLLAHLLKTNVRYIGLLGPKTKMDRMISDLHKEDILISEKQQEKLYGPVGLDIGAETPEEIALPIVAEVKAVMSARSGTPLKDKGRSIHSNDALTTLSK